MAKPTGSCRHFKIDSQRGSQNRLIFNIKIDKSLRINIPSARVIARIQRLYRPVALNFLYRMIYITCAQHRQGGRRGKDKPRFWRESRVTLLAAASSRPAPRSIRPLHPGEYYTLR